MLIEVACISSITPNGSGSVFPRFLEVCPAILPSGAATNSFKCSAFTSFSKWSLNTLHCSVMCPFSWWYVQYKFWFLLAGSPPHLTWPSKIWFIFNPFQNLMNEFFECYIDLPNLGIRLLNSNFFPWFWLKTLGPWIFYIMWSGKSLTLTLLPVIFQPLILFNLSQKLMHTFGRLHG